MQLAICHLITARACVGTSKLQGLVWGHDPVLEHAGFCVIPFAKFSLHSHMNNIEVLLEVRLELRGHLDETK